MAKLVSKVYGDALFEAAMERDMLSPVYEEVQSLQTILMAVSYTHLTLPTKPEV